MKLENVTAKIRPRGRWESIDLGCAMARRSYGTILLAWLVCVWPLWIVGVIGFGMISDGGWHVWWSVLWIWITLGIAGKVPLHIISRELFGEKVTAWGVIKLWPKMLVTNFWRGIIGRFSVSRGLSMPVSQLEGLKGKAYKSRVNLLLRNGGDGTIQAVLVSYLLLLVTTLACLFFIMMVFQFYGTNDLFERLFEDFYSHGDDHSTRWLFLLFYCISLTLIEPLFVGAGFAMYVNSRTLTEGWDIELSFKRLSERLRGNFKQKGTQLLLVFCVLTFFMVSDVSADTAKERAERITSAEEYTVHKSQSEEKKSSGSSSSSSSSHYSGSLGGAGAVFQGISLLIFWAMVIVVLGLVIWVIIKNKHALNNANSLVGGDDLPVVKSVMGMDVTPESLPKALSEEARAAWLRGDQQLAMSLLYRGAISWMVNQGRVPILESDTEDDCVRRVTEKQISGDKDQFFYNLTESWVGLAYGKKSPLESEVMSMCDRWPFNREGGSL
ncbi:MAG: hypothetical protein ACI9E1_001035 [Cryomorphaceae bacterium]|jgi:hypothetical protein